MSGCCNLALDPWPVSHCSHLLTLHLFIRARLGLQWANLPILLSDLGLGQSWIQGVPTTALAIPCAASCLPEAWWRWCWVEAASVRSLLDPWSGSWHWKWYWRAFHFKESSRTLAYLEGSIAIAKPKPVHLAFSQWCLSMFVLPYPSSSRTAPKGSVSDSFTSL